MPQFKNMTRDQKRRLRTVVYLWLLIILLTLLVAASYTWFSISRTPRVSNMDMFISADVGLQLSDDFLAPDDKWGQLVDFQKLTGADTTLKPSTWSENRNSLVTVDYGSDGRVIDGSFVLLTDEHNANRNDDHAYYVTGTFYARSDSNVRVSLSNAIEVNGGQNTSGTYVIGTPIWNGQQILHENGGAGAEYAIRIGFRITNIEADGSPVPDEDVLFYIYEPNCDAHADPQITGYVETPSVDGGASLINPDRIIRQTVSTWSEASPVQRDVTVKELGAFLTNPELFLLKAGEMVRIDLYIWLEGQDIDCVNLIDDAQIIANIQFKTDYGGNGGIVEIPEKTQDEQ